MARPRPGRSSPPASANVYELTGGLSVRAAQRAGRLRFEGDRALLDQLLGVFARLSG